MVEEFDAVIFSARVSELTNVFRTRFGSFHIAWLRDRKTEGIRSFDEVRPEIELASLRKKQDGALGDRLAALRARAVIRRTSLATLTPPPNPCCVPSKQRAQLLAISQAASAARHRQVIWPGIERRYGLARWWAIPDGV